MLIWTKFSFGTPDMSKTKSGLPTEIYTRKAYKGYLTGNPLCKNYLQYNTVCNLEAATLLGGKLRLVAVWLAAREIVRHDAM